MPLASRAKQLVRELGQRALQSSLALVPAERHRLFALTIVIGGVCGLLAVMFHSAIRAVAALLIDPALDAPGHWYMLWTVLVPTAGAMLAGFILHYFVPNARGSGIPQVKLVFAAKSGRLRLRDAVGKFIVASIQIGSGSSLGREGPTVQICAGAASALARLFAISPNNRRRLLPVGAAAGVAAAFNAPIAAVTFVTEEIIQDLDQTLLSGVVVAAALAAVIERSILGQHPVFNVPRNYGLDHASSLILYAAMGCGAALLSRPFYDQLLGLRGYCKRRTGRFAWAWPGVGGFAAGLLAVICMAAFQLRGVTGDGYPELSRALRGELPLTALVVLMLAKFGATVVCYATGGAGGLFAPVLFMGAMLGGSFGELDRVLLQHADVQVGAFALVGMGALFAAVIRAPITSVLIIFEMTGSYDLVLPLMIANSAAYVLARRLYPTPIYEALLEQDGVTLPHAAPSSPGLAAFRVSDAMTTRLRVMNGDHTLAEAGRQIEDLPYTIYPVVDPEQGKLLGLVSDSRIRRRLAANQSDSRVREHAEQREYVRADQPLIDAVLRMNRLGVRQMAVVSAEDPTRLVGMLAMSDVMRAHVRAASGASLPPREGNDGMAWDAREAVAWPRQDTVSIAPISERDLVRARNDAPPDRDPKP